MNIDHPTLFDDILGTPVPTLHRAGAEQRAALEAERASATDLEAFVYGATEDRVRLDAARWQLLRREIDCPPVRLLLHTPATADAPARSLWTCSPEAR